MNFSSFLVFFSDFDSFPVHSTISSVGNLMYCIQSLAKKGVLKTIPLTLLSDSKNVNHYRVH